MKNTTHLSRNDQLEVIVIDDGSSDNTLVKTQQVFQSSDKN